MGLQPVLTPTPHATSAGLRYLSVCSGIEAASVAWSPLGFQPVAFAEVEAFPSAVLKHHYPTVPNWGDLNKFKEWPDANVDVLVGGTPCQSFSVAGLRAGLADPRGNLALTYLAVADRYRPEWVVWENVPGVLSSGEGRDFGAFLGGLAALGYGFAYRVLDAQYFGLAQRRKRVFVVGHLGDWRRAAAVLFERESLSGHPAPRREAGERVAGCLAPGAHPGGFNGQDAYSDMLVAGCPVLAKAVRTASGGIDREDMHTLIAHSLRADGFDASEDGTGRGTPIVTVGSLTRNLGKGAQVEGSPLIPIAFSAKDHGADAGDISPTLRAGGHAGSHANGGVMPAVAFDARQSDVIQYGDKTGPLDTCGFTMGIRTGMQVRRLTPRECERLQGFPDDYTAIPYRGKPAADGPRYKALGNSMAVPVMAWIGRRIKLVHALDVAQEKAS